MDVYEISVDLRPGVSHVEFAAAVDRDFPDPHRTHGEERF